MSLLLLTMLLTCDLCCLDGDGFVCVDDLDGNFRYSLFCYVMLFIFFDYFIINEITIL